jgi:hypothetical protein
MQVAIGVSGGPELGPYAVDRLLRDDAFQVSRLLLRRESAREPLLPLAGAEHGVLEDVFGVDSLAQPGTELAPDQGQELVAVGLE